MSDVTEEGMARGLRQRAETLEDRVEALERRIEELEQRVAPLLPREVSWSTQSRVTPDE